MGVPTMKCGGYGRMEFRNDVRNCSTRKEKQSEMEWTYLEGRER